MNKNPLYEEIKSRAYDLDIKKSPIPDYISQNLKYSFFEWQEEAFKNFSTYWKIREKENITAPMHLMFNMATGTGKTLLMASLILELYKKGYRKFLFFVNQNNIVGKTENNFLDSNHSKYLFKDKIIIDDKEVQIKKVDKFSDNEIEEIEIKFTTIQKLYNDIHMQKENQTTLEDLIEKNIVMLADEAHHLNSDTKKSSQLRFEPEELSDNSKDDVVEKFGWEHTVLKLILEKNNRVVNNKNILLEFTATIPNDKDVQDKYFNKIIYKFDLKEFLRKGYTKEINLISSTFNKKDRILQALFLNWYRHEIAIKHKIHNFKPVMLFRSKTIEDSKNDYELFLDLTNEVSLEDFKFLENLKGKMEESDSVYEQGKTRTQKIIDYLDGDFTEVVRYIRENFKERNCIITNSKTNTTKTKEKTEESQDRLLNSLENKDNHIRAIFTVDRLTEGWDVLNLYDIVRLYEGQASGGSTKKTPETTVKEIQLIGRGVRYFPFDYKDKIKNKRKFDNDLNNELRVLEELYYYTYDEDSKYITDLKKELKEKGYIEDDKIYKEFKLKESFKQTKFYSDIKLISNRQIKKKYNRKTALEDLSKNFFKEYRINENKITEDSAFDENIHEVTGNFHSSKFLIKKIKDFEKHIFLKAMNIKTNASPGIFGFKILKEKLGIKSIEDLQKIEFLGDFEIKLIIPSNIDFEILENSKKLSILIKFLEDLFDELDKNLNEMSGSDFDQYISFKEVFGESKSKAVDRKNIELSNVIEKKLDLKNSDWYVLNSFVGTSEERSLIEFVGNTIFDLQEKYEEVYILRNEEVYIIYDFKTGKGFQPDFLMFLKEPKEEFFYQIFIEPKGEQLREKDAWKNEFLSEITKKYSSKEILRYEGKNYCLIGLPFYTSSMEQEFEIEYNKILTK